MPTKRKTLPMTSASTNPTAPKKVSTRVTPVEVDRMRRSAYDVVRRSMPDIRSVLRGEKNWSNQQVRLFSILLNKVLPDLHHSYNEHSHEISNLSALSITELERIATGSDTRVINAHAVVSSSSPGSARSSTPASSSSQDDSPDPSDVADSNPSADPSPNPSANSDSDSDPSVTAFENEPAANLLLEPETYVDVGAFANVRARANSYIDSIRFRALDTNRAPNQAELDAIQKLREYKAQVPTVADLDRIMKELRNDN